MKKIAIIGSGVGGSAIAALLANQGADVRIFERNNFTGGKASSYERDRFTCDMGIHFTACGDKGPLRTVARKVSADLTFLNKNPMFKIIWDKKSCTIPVDTTGIFSLAKLALTTGVKIKNYRVALKIWNKLISPNTLKDVEPYNDIPLKDFLYQYTDDQELHNLIEIFCTLLITTPMEEASAGEFMWCFSTSVKNASYAYPKGGFGEICNSYLRTVRKNGGAVHMNESIKQIKVENNRAIGVETEKGVYPADIVISNAGVKKTIELAGKNQFDDPYVKNNMQLKDSLAAIGIKYALDYKPTDIPVTLYCEKGFVFQDYYDQIRKGNVPEANPPMFIPCTTAVDSTLAPSGKHILLAGTSVPLNYKTDNQLQLIINRIDQAVMRLFPGIEKHIIFKHTTDVNYIKNVSGRYEGDLIGLAQNYDQVGINRPKLQTPIDGLFVVGSDAGGNGVGTEMAADSALQLERLITQKYG